MMMILVHVHPLLLLCCGGIITSICKEILLVASVFPVFFAVVLRAYVVPVCRYQQVNSLA